MDQGQLGNAPRRRLPHRAYINVIAGERIGRVFNAYSTTGTGVGQPKGILTAGTLGKTAAATNAITYEEVLDLIHSIDAGYRNSPSFRLMFHDTTLAALRKLKDGSGRYLFEAGTAGAPARVLDVPYVVNNDMPQLSAGTGSKVIAAGDFSRYFVRDVTGVTVVRATELFVGSGLVGFRVFSRHDANLTDANSVKYLKTANSNPQLRKGRRRALRRRLFRYGVPVKIKFTTSLVGADFVRHPGEVADIDDAEAARLIVAGYAKPVGPRPQRSRRPPSNPPPSRRRPPMSRFPAREPDHQQLRHGPANA